MLNLIMKFGFSLPGLTIWMFAVQFAISMTVLGLGLGNSILYAAVLSIFLAFQTSKKLEGTFFLKKIESGEYTTILQFKKLLEQGTLPSNPEQYADFREYLQYVKRNVYRRSVLKQNLAFILALGIALVFIAYGSLATRVFSISLILLYSYTLRSNMRGRRNLALLSEQLEAHR